MISVSFSQSVVSFGDLTQTPDSNKPSNALYLEVDSSDYSRIFNKQRPN